MYKKYKAYKIPESIFNAIIINHRSEYIADIYDAPKNKKIVYYNEKELLCLEYVLDSYTHSIDDATEWKQCICTLSNVVEKPTKSIAGNVAFRQIKNLLLKDYTEQEIKDIFNAHTVDYNAELKQVHFLYTPPEGIAKYNNCYRWDINSAHADALCELFPKSKKRITKMYEDRKIKPINKDYLNYYVGYLCCIGHRGTYNWIVQRTTKILQDAINKVGGTLLYANTDCLCVADPEYKIDNSKEIGNFKLEYNGDCYTYHGKNYGIIQFGDEIKGNLLYAARKCVDLRIGTVVAYDKAKEGVTYIPKNIIAKKEQIYEINQKNS